MTISVAQKSIKSESELSSSGRHVLALIDGGRQWFHWAETESRPTYTFLDEAALLAGIQERLHATTLVLLPRLGLTVGVRKLLTMSSAELGMIVEAENDVGAPVPRQLQEIVADNGLATQAELERAAAFLTEVGVADAPVFQMLSLDDRLEIHRLSQETEIEGADAAASPGEAADFAVRQARTPREFADYHRAYLQLSVKTGAPSDKTGRATRARSAFDTLLPHLLGALDCPQVDGLLAPAEVASLTRTWVAMGRHLGFARRSLGVQQVIQNTPFTDETGDAARAIVIAYLSEAQAFLTSAQPQRGIVGQDGASCTYQIADGNRRAELHLSATGKLTLGSFRTAPAPAP